MQAVFIQELCLQKYKINRYLIALMLVGTTRENLVLNLLAVQYLNNCL